METESPLLDGKIVAFRVFVSMPYDAHDQQKKYWSSFYHDAVEPSKTILQKETPFRIEFTYKKRDISVGEIPALVAASLDEADILLCVLTDFKPNVMFEVGYARRMKIPIIFLLDQSQAASVPILIGKPQTLFYDGSSQDSVDAIPMSLWQYLKAACWEAKDKKSAAVIAPSPIYLARCYQNRDYFDIPQAIRNAKSEIEILTTNVDYFAAPLEQTVEHPFRVRDLREAIKRGVRVSIWTMDPDSNIVLERSKSLKPAMRADVFQYRKALLKNVRTLYVAFKEEIKSGKFLIGIYDALPTLMIYRFDHRYIIPSVSLIERSRLCIHVEFRETDPGVKDTYEATLNEIRRIARPVEEFSWIREDWPSPHVMNED